MSAKLPHIVWHGVNRPAISNEALPAATDSVGAWIGKNPAASSFDISDSRDSTRHVSACKKLGLVEERRGRRPADIAVRGRDLALRRKFEEIARNGDEEQSKHALIQALGQIPGSPAHHRSVWR